MSTMTAAIMLGSALKTLRQGLGVLWRCEARFKGVEFEGRCHFQGRPILSRVAGSRMVLGPGVSIISGRRDNPLGLFQPSVLRTLAPGARLMLGPRVGISGTVLCAAAAIEVGEGTIMGAGAMVLDNDFHQPSGEWDWVGETGERARPVVIGRGVFIGARAIILKGVTIGDRARVGAGAVVTRDVPAYSLAVGNPARVSALRRPANATGD